MQLHARGLHGLKGAVNGGALVADGRALLIDCCDSLRPADLEEVGATHVDAILLTQYRRPNSAGAARWADLAASIVASVAHADLLRDGLGHWRKWENRRHLYHFQPGPLAPVVSLPVTRMVHDGEVIEWGGHSIRVVATPGATDGGVSYLITLDRVTFAFCGDLIYDGGRLWDLHSLQKGFEGLTDYHGFLGHAATLTNSLRKLLHLGVDVLVPSHGPPIHDPAGAVALLEKRLDALCRNYASISAINHYFPHILNAYRDDPQRMTPATRRDWPEWVRRVAYTSHAVVSESGAALLVDCGHDSVLTTLDEWRRTGTITHVDACWVTHYHDDHVDSLHRVAHELKCPILTERHLAEIVEHPHRFHLPCISPCGAPVARAVHHGESWRWHEFTLTAMHFPGQTLYHGGLLVEGHGERVMFAGDSGAPTGLDDYTCGNRVFLRAGAGFRRCIDLWREYRPDYIVNSHQDKAFAFTEAQLDYMDHVLANRERLVADLVPWEDPNFALDEGWVRVYPFEQDAFAGGDALVEVHFTNHGPRHVQARAELVAPEGWASGDGVGETVVAPRTSGFVEADHMASDGAIRLAVRVHPEAPRGLYAVPVRITWDGAYLGQFRHAIVAVR